MTDTAANARPFGIRDKIGYALGDFACNLSFTLLSTYMMLYYMQYMLIKESDWAWIHDTLYKKDNAESVLEGDGAVIPQEAKESVSDEIFETTAVNTDNMDIINTDTENPDNDRDS